MYKRQNKQVVGNFSEAFIVIGAVPAGVPAAWVSSDGNRHFFVGREFIPQLPDQLGIFIPLRVGDVFYIDVNAVQIITRDGRSDFIGQLINAVQGIYAGFPVPMV